MKLIPITEAKANLSSLIERAADGEEIVIARNGSPVARLVPYRKAEPKRRKPGLLRGKVWIAEGFTGSPSEIAEALSGETATTRRRKARRKPRKASA